MEQIKEMLDKIYGVVLNIQFILSKKQNTTNSKFEEAVEHIKSIPKFSVHTSKVADLIYPKIYQSRQKAVTAIRKMVSIGILKQESEYITKANTI